ncbi:MAG: hypothetical protein HY560_01265 [Gemmatimonadetes bacterium]|nr:hypothetical protein [Gemmatimonadota bacterium]
MSAHERDALIARFRALAAEQQRLLGPLMPETRRWESLGLDAATGLCLALGDDPDLYERVRKLDHEMLAVLNELGEIDPRAHFGDLESRIRWVLGLDEPEED